MCLSMLFANTLVTIRGEFGLDEKCQILFVCVFDTVTSTHAPAVTHMLSRL